jgi:hypothetical protein
VNGLAELVPLAEQLAALTGSSESAIGLAVQIVLTGEAALPKSRTDATVVALRQLREAGCVDNAGHPVAGRASELVTVCGVLAATSPPPTPLPVTQGLVLSAPTGTARIEDRERLSNLVMSTLRSATDTIHLAGAFWNESGFDQLNTLYLNVPDKLHLLPLLRRQISACRAAGDATVYWFTGHSPTLQHVKFAISDRSAGYLGTANLTSWGMDEGHVEAGVQLTSHQAARLVEFFEDLHHAGMFSTNEP